MATTDHRAPCPCGSGRRYKSCCLGRDRSHADMLETAQASHREVNRTLDVLLPLVESRGEHTIACRAGCSACCTQHIRLTWPEALLIAEWLLEEAQAPLLARFEAALPGWLATVGDEAALLDAILARNDGSPAPGSPDFQPYVDGGFAYHRKLAMCPFNDDAGSCSIYPVRPLPCRSTHVVDTAEYCAPDRGGQPKVLKHPALQGLLVDRLSLLKLANRSTGRPLEGALPRQVEAALAEVRRRAGIARSAEPRAKWGA